MWDSDGHRQNDTLANNKSLDNQNWYGPHELRAIATDIIIMGIGDTLGISGEILRFFYVSGGSSLTRMSRAFAA